MPTEKTARTFIAIPLLAGVRQELTDIQHFLAQSEADVKWVRTGSIHLTLRFLGDVAAKKLKLLRERFPHFYQDIRPFEISFDRLGAFPGIVRPRVLWVGIGTGEKETAGLALKTDEGLNQLGFSKEKRPFAAHATLGRIRSGRHITALTTQLESYSFPAHPRQTISRVELMKSTLTSEGPVYETLAAAQLD